MTAERTRAALAEIEATEGVRVLYAVESGSRAWGIPSQDSDYDARFVYVRPVDDYLTIDELRDVIERPVMGDLDVNGWDVRKALQLFRKSNPPLLEWLHSPIVYAEPHTLATQMRGLETAYFNARASVYHYLHMGRGNFRQYLQGEQVRTKKYFYVLRPILACMWLERFETTPPVGFGVLLETMLPPDGPLVEAIHALLVRKLAGDEFDDAPPIPVLHDFLTERIAYYEEAVRGISASTMQPSIAALDNLFRDTLREVWGGWS